MSFEKQSNWLELCIECNCALNKQQFWDSLRLKYNWSISCLPTICPCGEKLNVQRNPKKRNTP